MNFESLVGRINLIQDALQAQAAHAVNLSLTARNWLVGYYIVEKAPDNRNYGFWNDTNMNINDFINQKSAEFISKEEFESVWNEELHIFM